MKKNILVRTNITIQKAMILLNKTGENCLLVTDRNKKLKGTLTDGDLRRGILNGFLISDAIEKIYNNKPLFLFKKDSAIENIKRLMISKKVDLVPIVDEKLILKSYLTWEEAFKKSTLKKNRIIPAPTVVIMAGGEGVRMKPFTNILPKPLVPIGEKTVIETIFDSFKLYGINTFFVTVKHKHEIIKAYFNELKHSYKLNLIVEKKKLGTAGSLRSILKITKNPIIVNNCDTLVNANYKDLYYFHRKGRFGITLVASTRTHEIPYGVCKLSKKGTLELIDEKPKFSFLANIGLYVVNPELLKYIPKDKYYDFTDFVKDLISKKIPIGVYPISEDAWKDVGQWNEYKSIISNL